MAEAPAANLDDIFLDMSEILPGELYLGSRRAAHNYEILRKQKISDVICIIIEDPRYIAIKRPEFRYHNIPLADSSSVDLARHFVQCFDVIENARASKNAVLVHCEAGVSRSPTIVISYLMKAKRLPLVEAYKFVKHRRRFIGPNWGFLKQLWQFEKALFPSPNPPPSLGELFQMQMFGTFENVPPARIQLSLEKHNFDIPEVIEEICKEEEEKLRAKDKEAENKHSEKTAP